MSNPFQKIVDFEHIFTPLAIERLTYYQGGRRVILVYVFGIRVMYWNIGW